MKAHRAHLKVQKEMGKDTKDYIKKLVKIDKKYNKISKKKLGAKSLKFKKEMAVVIGDLKKIHQKAVSTSTVNTLEVVEPVVEPV